MKSREPRFWATAAIRVSTLLLPDGLLRRRYRDELGAELWGMTWGRQLRHVLSILASAPSLRRALFEAGELDFPHSSSWCRLHLHHRWRIERTEDGSQYRRCRACGTDQSAGMPSAKAEGMAFAYVMHWY